MALPRQLIPLPFTQGADTKLDSFLLPPGKLTVAQNVYVTKNGSVNKRPGNISLGNLVTDGTTITKGQGIAAYRNELVVMDNYRLLSYAPSLSAFKPKPVPLHSVTVSTKPIVRSQGNFTQADQATNTTTGLQLVTYSDGSLVRYSIVDTVTGQTLVDRAALPANSVYAKPMACGSYLVAIYSDLTAAAMKYVVFTGTTASAPIVIQASLSATAYFDAAILPGLSGSDPVLAVAWNSTDVSGGIRIQAFSATTVNTIGGVFTIQTGHTANGGLTIIADTSGASQRYIIAYNDLTNTRVVSCLGGSTGVTTGGGISDQIIVAAANNAIVAGQSFNTAGTSTGRIYWTAQGTDHSQDLTSWATWSGNTVTSQGAYVLGMGIAGKPFVQDTVMWLPVYFDPNKTGYTGQQPTYFIVSDGGAQAARLYYGLGGGRAGPVPSEMQNVGTGQWVFPCTFVDLLTTVPASPALGAPPASGSLPSYVYTTKGISCVTLNFFNQQAAYSTAELADSLYIGGGQLWQYDGTQLVEHGFNLYPEGVTVSVASGGVLQTGSYVWYAVYEWTDAQGRVHQSAPSPGVQLAVTSGTTAATITLPCYRLGAKVLSNISIVVYRTAANLNVPYRVGSVANNYLANTVTFTDSTVADTALTAAPPIYVLGSVAENLPVGPVSSLTIFKNRVFGILAEDPLTVAYSKQVLPGAPLEFNPDEFYLRADPIGGKLTALAVMDDKLILFKQDRILFVAGDGPDPTGQNGQFTDPAIVTTDIGDIDPRSIVFMPRGVMFRGRKGIYLLDRGMNVQYIGAGAETILDGLTVVSAILEPTIQQVRFGLSDNKTVLVYDYLNDQWTWNVGPALASVGACIFQGLYTFLQPAGVVGQESPTTFTDFGNFIKMTVETSWLSPAQLNGYARLYEVQILGRFKSSHLLRTSIAYDNAESYVASGDLASTSLFGTTTWGGGTGTWGSSPPTYWGGDGSPMFARFEPSKQKCSSFKLRVEDFQIDNAYGESCQLTGLSLLIGAKQGLRKLPATLQVPLK